MSRAKKALTVIPLRIDSYVANLLEKISDGKRVLTLPKGERIFAQSDCADAIFLFSPGIDDGSDGFTVRTELRTDVVLHD